MWSQGRHCSKTNPGSALRSSCGMSGDHNKTTHPMPGQKEDEPGTIYEIDQSIKGPGHDCVVSHGEVDGLRGQD